MPRISETKNPELYSQALAAGIVGSERPIITDHLDGTYTIQSFDCLLYDNDVHEGSLRRYTIPGSGPTATTPNSVTYLVVDNQTTPGSPVLVGLPFEELYRINESNIIPVYSMFNELDETLHVLDWDMVGQGVANKLHTRFVKTQRFQRENGLDISVTNPAKSVQLSEGKVWAGGNQHNLDSADSSNGDIPKSVENLVGGSGYVDGEYTNVTTSYGGAGTGLTVDATVEGGVVVKASITDPATDYCIGGDFKTPSDWDINNTDGSGFSIINEAMVIDDFTSTSAPNFQQNPDTLSGVEYTVKVTVTNWFGTNTVPVYLGSALFGTITGNGVHEFTATTVSPNPFFFAPSVAPSVQQITATFDDISITQSQGSGYTSREVVNIDLPTGAGATVTVIPDRFGFWHTTGTGLTMLFFETGGVVDAGGSIGSAGSGYHVGDILEIYDDSYPGGGRGATISVDTVNASGGVTAFTLLTGGSGYSAALNGPVYEGWTFHTKEDGTGVYNNEYYDGGVGVGLVPLNAGEFAVNWIYRDIEHAGHMGHVLCSTPYNTYAEAAGSRPRTDLPDEFGVLGILVGRVIVEQGQTDGIAESAFADVTLEGFVQGHSGLAGIQGGQTDEYFHLTSAEHAHNSAGFPVNLTAFLANINNNTNYDIHGALQTLTTAQPLNSGAPINISSKGPGKVLLVLNAGGDFTGSISVTGTVVDRDTGVETVSQTDVLTIDSLTTDASANDVNGNLVHDITSAYVTDRWFTDSVVISTTDVTLTDVDVYHVSYEQFNDEPNIILDTIDINHNVLSTSATTHVSAHLYTLELDTGNKYNITSQADLLIPEPNPATGYWRLRKGALGINLDGTTDGVWVETYFSGTNAHKEFGCKVWARILPEV